LHPLVLLAFILSGISSLTLEIIWTRMLEHVFGATTLAIATVLTCFMGGLALGSWLFGRFADRLKSPLTGYAVAEGIVGVCAFAIPLLIEHVYPGLNKSMAAAAGNSFWLFSLLRFVAVAVALIIPTTCMGATLPLLARHVITHEAHMLRVGSRVGMLYTLNIAGAIGGVFLATFALLPLIGLSATNKVAGTINIVLCLVLLVLRKWIEPRQEPVEIADADMEIAVAVEGARSFEPTRAQRNVTLIAFLLSGLAAMNLQVVWNRAMALVIGSSVYSFALVLLAFLVGLALGSALLSSASKRLKNPVMVLALVELFIAGSAIANYLYMDDLPRIFATLVTGHIEAYEDHVGLVQFIMFSVAALAALPATIGMGATFPLTIRIVAKGLRSVGKDVGSVYALNTLGAICGSFLSAFVFVPLFSRYFDGAGMQTTFFLSVGIYAALGLALLAVARGLRLVRAVVAVPAAALVLLFLIGAPGWDPAALTIGVFRISLMKNALDEESWGDPDVKYYHDGVTTTVSIELWGRHFALKNNGKVDASNGDDMPTQIMIAAYPLLFHPRGSQDLDVAIIGYGSGVTVGAALQFPIDHVDVVELENAVIEASTVFGAIEGETPDPELDVNHLVYRRKQDPQTGAPNPEYNWTDPDTYVINDRLRIFSDDGRNFLASTDAKYDVIVSEPSNPWITGVSNMFTVESFESSAKALKPDGIFAQWVQLYEMSPENIKTIFRTFASVFPYVAAFAAEDLSSDTVLLGSFKPLEFDLGRVEREFDNPDVAAELERAYVLKPPDAFARVLLVDREELLDYTNGPDEELWGDLPLNTDDNARIEFSAPRDMISFRRFAGYLATIYTDEWPYAGLGQVMINQGVGDQLARNLAEQALSLLQNGRKREAGHFLERAEELAPREPAVSSSRQIAVLLSGLGGTPLPEIEEVTPSATMTAEQHKELEHHLSGIERALEIKAHQDSLERFARIPDHLWRRGGPQMLLLKGYLHFLNADPADSAECEESIEILSQLVREHEGYVIGHPEVHYFLGLCHDNALHFDKAVKNVRSYVELTSRREEHARIAVIQAAANLEAALLGAMGTMPIDLPPDAADAPTTDAQGESPKESHSTP
jgi:spermidine synthase